MLSSSLYLAHSRSDANFGKICEGGRLLSSDRLAALGIPLDPSCTGMFMKTTGSVFFYVAPFRYPNTGCGLLFATTLESAHPDEGLAAPFDSGALRNHLTRPDPAESPQAFLSRHELPLPEHRRYLGMCMGTLFRQPGDYVEGADPHLPGPVGLTGGDQRRWTHEVRIPDEVALRSEHLQAVFVPKSALENDARVRAFLHWCATQGVDRITFNAPRGEGFASLQQSCMDYIQRRLY